MRHGEDVQLTCDSGYVVYNTTSTQQSFTCDRSDNDDETFMGSFGMDWMDMMKCEG